MNTFRANLASLKVLAVTAAVTLGAVSAAEAQVAGGRVLYGVQPATGKIVPVNPATGAVGAGYNTPTALAANDTLIGLSGAEGGNVLIYRNSSSATASDTLYRLNPVTGATLSTATADGFSADGLTYENNGTDRIFYSHSNSDIHFQSGYGGSTSFFYVSGASIGGLGGDALGRDFGFFTDNTIKEFNGTTGATSAILNSFNAPATSIQGLAFDGVNLYASTSTGLLYTLNANTGAVLGTVTVQGGALYGLGTAVPEPTAGLAALTAVAGLTRRTRRPRA